MLNADFSVGFETLAVGAVRKDEFGVQVPESADSERSTQLSDHIAKIEYVEQMLRELRVFSSELDAAMLTYLIEMAAIEASETLKVRSRQGFTLSDQN